MMYVRELIPDDVPAIGHLEAMLHPHALVDGTDNHRHHLSEALAESVNLSFGVFDDDRLVGYLLCYGFEPTAFPDAHGEVLYVEDVAVLPQFRRALPILIRRLTHDARRHFPGAAVEAHSLRSVYEFWQQHAASMARLGLQLARYMATGEMVNGEARYLVRWEPVADQGVAAPNLDQMLTKLPEHTVELDGHHYVLKVVRDDTQWQVLESLWEELLLATPGHTVFQSYAYQRLWWRHFGSDNELCIVVILREGTVQGIAPLQIQMTKYYGRYCRQLGFIGSRWEVDRPTFLFPQDGPTLQRVLARFLAQRADRWDIGDFYEQITDPASLDDLEKAFRSAGYLVGRTRDSDCAYLAIQGSWPQFLAKKSSTFRKNLKTAGRRLRESGDLHYRVYDTAPEVLQQLELYRDVEARSWKSSEGVGVSRNTDYFDFYRELAEAFARHQAFVIRMLTVDGKAIAGTFGLAYDGIYYSLQIAHDREFSRCSPGTYLEALEMEQCFDHGYREYEFLGGFLNNKSRWTSTFRYTTQLHLYRRTPFFLALYVLLFRIKPRVKDLLRLCMKSWRKPAPDQVTAGD